MIQRVLMHCKCTQNTRNHHGKSSLAINLFHCLCLRMRFRNLIVPVCVLFACTGSAQPVFDVAHLNGIEMPVQGSGSGNADSLKPQIRNVHAFLQIPLDLSPRTTLIVFPYFEQKSFAYPRISSEQTSFPFIPSDFSCYAFTLTGRHTFADTSWRLFTAFSVRHYGEQGLSPGKGSIIPAGAAFFERRFSRDFALRAGLFLSREYFGNLWLPLVGFNWKASDRLWCWGLLPRFAVADYRINSWWHVCLHFRGINESYLFAERADGRQGWLALQEGQLRLGQEFYLPKTPMVFTMDVGHTVNRTLRAYDPSLAEEMETKPSDGLFFRLSLVWRLHLDDRFGKQEL